MTHQQTSWNIAMIQCDVHMGRPAENRESVGRWMEQAVSQAVKPDLIVLPEMWNTGYALQQIHELADVEGSESRAWISAFAQRHKVHVVAGSIAEKRGGEVYNTMRIFDRTGQEIAAYSKMHLFRLMQEEKHLSPGESQVTFELDGQTSGASICYDIRFPELMRTLALRGAKVLFVPAAWPHPRLHHWRTLLMARAIENQMYVVACNRTGQSGQDHFFGHSMIIDPWGEVLAEGGEEEGILTGQIDLSLVDDVRSRIPVFEDRRPGLYHL
ncbi:carbon-nitrogen family hydrolase [Paenibacillus ihumii]|uniref:carbon-nitrogen family hydrolase n=1 Tax=Paenibacillus ihumii TaxID=687436 RepID=UPI0006D7F75C|nr:carbon-nitrogen family hydrolase [Paenibacillus ihumii]